MKLFKIISSDINGIKLFKILLLIFVNCIFLLFYGMFAGFIPKITYPSLGISFVMLGTAGSISASNGLLNFSDNNTLIPYGGTVHEMFTYYLAVSLINKIINNIELSSSIFYCLLFLISYVCTIYLFFKITHKIFFAVLITIIWFIDPFFIAQFGLQAVQLGLLMVPLSVIIDYKIYNLTYKLLDDDKILIRGLFTKILIIYLMRLTIVATSWYVGAIVASASCLFFLIYFLIFPLKKNKRKILFKLFFFVILLPWTSAILTINLIMPTGTTSFKSPLEIFRGNSVDLATIFLPRDSQLISKLFSVDNFLRENSLAFSGDGTMWSNYIGITLLFIVLFILIKEKFRNKTFMAGLLTGIVMLFLSLGPSLKVFSTIPANAIQDYNSYILSSDQVLFDFPWKSIYTIFPLNMMRATYRWILVPKFLLLLSFAYFIRKYFNTKKFICITFCLLIFIEFVPSDFSYQRGIEIKKKLESFNQDVIISLKKYDFDKNDRFLFIPSEENDFLAPYISHKVQIKMFNGGEDKSVITASRYMPKEIQKALNEKDLNKLRDAILEINEKKLVDFIILPFFSLRWDSYHWPVNDVRYSEYKTNAKILVDYLDDFLNIYEDKYFYLIDLKNNKREILINENNIKVNANNPFEKSVYIQDNDFKDIYLSLYAKADKNKTIESIIKITWMKDQNIIATEEHNLEIDTIKHFGIETKIAEGANKFKINFLAEGKDAITIKEFQLISINKRNYESHLGELESLLFSNNNLNKKIIEAQNVKALENSILLEENSFIEIEDESG